MKLSNGIHAYLWPGLTMAEMQRYGNNCNSYLFANVLPEGKHVLVDPGQIVNETGQNCLDRLVSEMGKDGLAIEDVGLVIATHLHPDHYGAAEEIKGISGAMIATGEQEYQFLKEGQRRMAAATASMVFSIPEINPDFLLGEGELRLGPEMSVEVLLTPGHSVGHIGIYSQGMKAYFGGDLIFYGSTGRVDFPGGSAQMLKDSIERVARLDIDYLLTGHQYGGQGVLEGKEAILSNFDSIRRNVFPYL
ncbi:MBL fold metallo-hydrolase [Chloroflexota bacterium]